MLTLEKEAKLNITDNTGNTPLHELVSSPNIDTKKSIDLIRASRKRNLSDLLKVKNKDKQTVLYIASKEGKKEVVEFLLKEGARLSDTDETGHSALYQLICSIDSSTDKCIELINNLTDQYIEEAIESEKQTSERRSETILHVIAANGLTPLVNKFAFVDFDQKDFNGDTVLHTAVRNRRFETLKEIVRVYEEKPDKHDKNEGDVNLKDLLNAEDADGETVLHLACKLADVKIIQYLIKKGSDLEAQDQTDNTPLHDLVDKAATDEAIDKYIDVWKVLIENVVAWWCSKLQLPQKYKSSFEYKTYQRDAVYYLRSEIPNDRNLSVIQLAATKGLVRLVREMIWVEGVFVIQCGGGTRVKIDVTNLMPHLGGGEDVKYMKSYPPDNAKKTKHFLTMDAIEEILDDESDDESKGWKVGKIHFDSDDDLSVGDVAACCCECYDDGFDSDGCIECGLVICCFPCIMSYLLFGTTHGRKRHSLLDAILQVHEGNKAHEIFQIQPMKQLVRDYWFSHQWWTFIMLTVHLIYMTLYSSYSLEMINNAFKGNGTNETTPERLNGNVAYLIWPVMLVAPYVGLLLASPLLCLIRSGKLTWIKERIIGVTDIDVKDIFNLPIMFLSAFVQFIPMLIPLLFCIATIGAIELTKYGDIFFSEVTSYSLILGWLLTFYWASAFEPVFRFISTLKMIILKDIMSFLFFYIFVLLAYSHGIFIILSTVPSLSQEYPTLNNVLFELLLVGCGADSRMSSDDIGSEFEKVGSDPLLFKLLFTSYIIVTMVGLLNLIIASMCDSYKKFTETDNQGWRQHSLKMSRNSIASYFISSKLLHPMFKTLKITEQRVWQERFNVTKKQWCTCDKNAICNCVVTKKQPCTCDKNAICNCVKTGHFLLKWITNKLSLGKQ